MRSTRTWTTKGKQTKTPAKRQGFFASLFHFFPQGELAGQVGKALL